ncbi:helix-turn-helix transcriptional regulator [Rhizobium binxianense]|uniref:helix-turn-helix transcriptional regulator n=1 Tax=Rhizobium binxianense TaxID=3024242 RepID=UPI0023609376|nr:helix-turn-helix transcriptional regulator [Rhizobium sp. MJ37]MDC9837821.1 helix-turn-helix transcriptional regulator [Rhizobium sp. MJ37]
MESEEYRHLGDLIRACGENTFCERLGSWLRLKATFDLISLVVYRGSAPPIHVFDNFPLGDARDGMMTFLTQTYVLNAFFQSHQNGLPTGVYRLRDLNPTSDEERKSYSDLGVIFSENEEAGYVTTGWPQQLEEVDIAVDLGGKETVEIGLYRNPNSPRFENSELEKLAKVLPVIAGSFSKHWETVGSQLASDHASLEIDQGAAFESFGENTLSAREREVMAMILRGHSSESIASHLEISITTVKTHRKRAYQKLSISTQAELLSLFLRHLQTGYSKAQRPVVPLGEDVQPSFP